MDALQQTAFGDGYVLTHPRTILIGADRRAWCRRDEDV
jgi:hypothetical protein